jgi:hypothetical protein
MIQCPECQATFVANTLFCSECGLYLPECEPLSTEPLDLRKVQWAGEAADPLYAPKLNSHDWGALVLHLSIGKGDHVQEIEIALDQPIRLGRMDPSHDIFPEIDLTAAMGLEQGVSRRHACIFSRGDKVEIEDLGSTNGTLLNEGRLVPYLPEDLNDGDRLQLGRLPILVHVRRRPSHTIRAGEGPGRHAGHRPGS